MDKIEWKIAYKIYDSNYKTLLLLYFTDGNGRYIKFAPKTPSQKWNGSKIIKSDGSITNGEVDHIINKYGIVIEDKCVKILNMNNSKVMGRSGLLLDYIDTLIQEELTGQTGNLEKYLGKNTFWSSLIPYERIIENGVETSVLVKKKYVSGKIGSQMKITKEHLYKMVKESGVILYEWHITMRKNRDTVYYAPMPNDKKGAFLLDKLVPVDRSLKEVNHTGQKRERKQTDIPSKYWFRHTGPAYKDCINFKELVKDVEKVNGVFIHDSSQGYSINKDSSYVRSSLQDAKCLIPTGLGIASPVLKRKNENEGDFSTFKGNYNLFFEDEFYLDTKKAGEPKLPVLQYKTRTIYENGKLKKLSFGELYFAIDIKQFETNPQRFVNKYGELVGGEIVGEKGTNIYNNLKKSPLFSKYADKEKYKIYRIRLRENVPATHHYEKEFKKDKFFKNLIELEKILEEEKLFKKTTEYSDCKKHESDLRKDDKQNSIYHYYKDKNLSDAVDKINEIYYSMENGVKIPLIEKSSAVINEKVVESCLSNNLMTLKADAVLNQPAQSNNNPNQVANAPAKVQTGFRLELNLTKKEKEKVAAKFANTVLDYDYYLDLKKRKNSKLAYFKNFVEEDLQVYKDKNHLDEYTTLNSILVNDFVWTPVTKNVVSSGVQGNYITANGDNHEFFYLSKKYDVRDK